MRQAEADLVRALPLFENVSEKHFDELMSTAFLQRFPQGVTLIREGDLPDFLHIVVEGSVELFATHDAHETALDILEPVTTFILAAVIRDEVYLKSARTLTPAQILMIPAAAVRAVFDRDAAFARALVNELAMRYRCVVRSLKNEKLRNSTERLANWILQEDAHQGGKGQIALTIDKRTLASRLGMTPENLSRNLAQLAKHGVVTSGPQFIISDVAALREFAKPNSLIDQ
ncbi:MAG: helix-turn-helix domain-containing protein [Pseudolabrys sp.]|nr:helix-turn-helix domain-containing protein [Pseudolabrys sp.]MDP2294866.1 helix-turn-helix domain-containing protein [Pseudolabrys sp.]